MQQCGKFAVLDRILVKQKASGHRVLLFSTMTRLLDLLEIYLRWRYVDTPAGPATMGFLRIDGSTSLEDRWAAPAGLTRLLFLYHIATASMHWEPAHWQADRDLRLASCNLANLQMFISQSRFGKKSPALSSFLPCTDSQSFHNPLIHSLISLPGPVWQKVVGKSHAGWSMCSDVGTMWANVYMTGPLRFGLPVDEACVQIKAGGLPTAFPVSRPSPAGCQVTVRFASITKVRAKRAPKYCNISKCRMPDLGLVA